MDMTPGHKQWKKFTLTGDALYAAWWPSPPFTLNNSISLGLNLFILIWIIPPGLNVTNATPPFIYSVGPGNQFMLSDPNIFFLLFRWFKFTLKPPYSIAHGKLQLAIWDTSFWTFWLKFGHKGP